MPINNRGHDRTRPARSPPHQAIFQARDMRGGDWQRSGRRCCSWRGCWSCSPWPWFRRTGCRLVDCYRDVPPGQRRCTGVPFWPCWCPRRWPRGARGSRWGASAWRGERDADGYLPRASPGGAVGAGLLAGLLHATGGARGHGLTLGAWEAIRSGATWGLAMLGVALFDQSLKAGTCSPPWVVPSAFGKQRGCSPSSSRLRRCWPSATRWS
jgi:hypothetical protein